jgi:hypothetical protein
MISEMAFKVRTDCDLLYSMNKLPMLALLAALPLAGQVTIDQGKDEISVWIDGKPYTTFYYGPEVAKPYLYPLLSPSGVRVTRGYPMDPEPGESQDHMHHRGVWFAHSAVNGYDYWNNEFSYKGAKLGHIFVTKIDKVQSGPKTGEIDATAEWKQPDGKVVLIENRKMIFHAGGPDRLVDFDFTLTAQDTVTFEDAKDGVFGIRLASELEEPNAPGTKSQPKEPVRTGVMTCANGKTTEKECWGTRADWVDYSGSVHGEKVGIAILDNPQNPEHPTYWHARGYGLFAVNIFGRSEFTNKKEPSGAVTLKPGEKMRFRYRVVIHPGTLTDAKIPGLYAAYAAGK